MLKLFTQELPQHYNKYFMALASFKGNPQLSAFKIVNLWEAFIIFAKLTKSLIGHPLISIYLISHTFDTSKLVKESNPFAVI